MVWTAERSMTECPRCRTAAGRTTGPQQFVCEQCGFQWVSTTEEKPCPKPFETQIYRTNGQPVLILNMSIEWTPKEMQKLWEEVSECAQKAIELARNIANKVGDRKEWEKDACRLYEELEQLTTNLRPKKLWMKNGSYVEYPHFIDYHDGVGLQLCGGILHAPNGKVLGHLDPPGPRGTIGETGSSKVESGKNNDN
jgi:transposase-like protein